MNVRLLLIVSCVYLILFGAVGCDKKDVAETPNAKPPSIMVDNVLYYSTGKEIPAEIDEADYLGRITSIVSISQLPTQNNQANIPFEDAPYAKYGDGIVVLMNEEWTLFEVRE